MRKMHQNETPVADCDYCEKKFKNRDVLQYHMKTTHRNLGKEELNKCEECGKAYTTKDHLSRHQRKQHTIVNKLILATYCNILIINKQFICLRMLKF